MGARGDEGGGGGQGACTFPAVVAHARIRRQEVSVGHCDVSVDLHSKKHPPCWHRHNTYSVVCRFARSVNSA